MLFLSGCGGPSWPDEQFPANTEVAKVLFAEGGGVMRETCQAMVVELTETASTRLLGTVERRKGMLVVVPPHGQLPISSLKLHSQTHGSFARTSRAAVELRIGRLARPLRSHAEQAEPQLHALTEIVVHNDAPAARRGAVSLDIVCDWKRDRRLLR